jgi:Trypsin-like peptidase domain
MTHRLSLFRQQALRPYKNAMTAISIVFVMALIVLGYFITQQNKTIGDQVQAMQEMALNIEAVDGNADSLRRVISQNQATQANLKNQLAQLQETVETVQTEQQRNPGDAGNGSPVPSTVALDPLFKSVYFVYVDKILVSFQGQTEEFTDYKWSGTGFLLDNKKFITARHVIESWFFFTEDDQVGMTLNMIANNGGSVVAYFTAYSPDGTSLSFKSTDFSFDRTGDQDLQTNDNDGNVVLLKKAVLQGGYDWASYDANTAGVIKHDIELSSNLNMQDKLHILGYPLGLGASDINDISPIYGNCIVSSDGLQNGIIYVTDRNFEHGNSGGPVFIIQDGQYVAIGIVSAGAGGSTGFIVPISSVRQ